MQRPIGSNLSDFPDLSSAERKILEACKKGERLNLSSERPTEKTDSNLIRASLLRFLALGGDEKCPVHSRGVNLSGAYIEGNLDLFGTKINIPIFLVNSYFSEKVTISDSEMKTLSLAGSSIDALSGDRLSCQGGLFLRYAFLCRKFVRLAGATVKGDIDLTESRIEGDQNDALILHSTNVTGNIFLTKAIIEKRIILSSINLGGGLDLTGGRFSSDEEITIDATSATIKGDVLAGGGIDVRGGISLITASVEGDILLGGRVLKNGNQAIVLISSKIGGDVHSVEDTLVQGQILMMGARVGGNLNLTKVNVVFPNERAVELERAEVAGALGSVLNKGLERRERV
jgi:hypothetical protein